MFSFAKLFADIAKVIGISDKVISYGLAVFVSVVATLTISTLLSNTKKNIDSVPVVLSTLDTVINRLDKHENRFCSIENKLETLSQLQKDGNDSINSNIRNGFGEFKDVLKKSTSLNNEKFKAINKSFEEKYRLQNNWIEEMIDKISFLQYKKNDIQLTTIP